MLTIKKPFINPAVFRWWLFLFALAYQTPQTLFAQEPYAVLSENNTVLTFYYDDQKTTRDGMSVGPFYYADERWAGHSGDITRVVFDDSFANCTTFTRTACWFKGCSKLKTITGIYNLKTDKVESMASMFEDCSSLTSLDVSSFNTENVADMSGMFRGCSNLTSLDVSGFNTENVTDLDFMFGDCSNLTSLDVRGFKTNNVTNMRWMFFRCSSLTSLDVSSFNTENVTDMSDMFRGCSNLTRLDVSGFNTDRVTTMTDMFEYCSSLTSLDVSGFNTENVTDMSNMFFSCSNLISLDVSGFKTDRVTNMSSMFGYCSSLTSLDVSGFKTNNVMYMHGMFGGCSGLTSLDVSNFKTENVTLMLRMFLLCSNLTSLDLSGFNTEKVTDMGLLFSGCSGLTSLNVSSFNTENVTKMEWMFNECYSLTSLDVSGFDTENVTDMSRMFFGCSNLTSLDVSGFKTDRVTTMTAMFGDCSSLTSLDVSGFDTESVTGMSGMFRGCSNLTSLDLSGFKTDNVTDMSFMFGDCSSLTSLDVSGFDTESVTGMSGMFSGCSNLTSLDLSGFKTDNVTDMEEMFYDCSSLTTIYVVNNWNMQNISLGNNVFYNCSSLVGVNETTYDYYHSDYSYARLDGGKDNPGYFSILPYVLPVNIAFDGHSVMMTCKEKATLYYTLDGSEPSTESLVYSGEPITLNDFCIVKAFAFNEGREPSKLATLTVNSLFDGVTARVRKREAFSEAFRWCGGVEQAEGLAAILWEGADEVTAETLAGVSNPNLLLYVNDYSQAIRSGVRNVVSGGLAQRITLTDNVREDGTRGPSGFYVPQAFRVQNDISYTHTYTQETAKGDCRGWETIALPFDVQTITHAVNGEAVPFAAYTAGKCPFWLCKLTEDGFTDAGCIEANTPYIISMPNNPQYSPFYCLNGEVTFSARGVTVPATELHPSSRGGASFIPTFEHVPASPSVYALNVGGERWGYAEGSLFDCGYRDVHPFEAYRTTPQQGVPYMAVGDELRGATDIASPRPSPEGTGEGLLFDLSGRRFIGRPAEKGVYIRNGKKIVVR